MQFRSEICYGIKRTCLFAFDQLLSFIFFARGQKKGCDCRLVGWYAHFLSQAGFYDEHWQLLAAESSMRAAEMKWNDIYFWHWIVLIVAGE